MFSIDIGANIGYFTILMASLGSKVISVEPQIDLARALKQSARVNCWSDRITVHNAFVSLNERDRNATRKISSGFGGRPIMAEHPKSSWMYKGDRCCKSTSGIISTVVIRDLFEDKRIKFVKIDIDSFDLKVMTYVGEMIKNGKTDVETIVIEANGAGLLEMLQLYNSMKYDIYIVNDHLDFRWFNSKGWDVYNHYRSIPINDSIVEEIYNIRSIKYILKIKPGKVEDVVSQIESLTIHNRKHERKPVLSYVLTRQNIFEKRWQHPVKSKKNGVTSLYSLGEKKYNYIADGTGYGP